MKIRQISAVALSATVVRIFALDEAGHLWSSKVTEGMPQEPWRELEPLPGPPRRDVDPGVMSRQRDRDRKRANSYAAKPR